MANLASALDSAFESEGIGSSSETVAPEPAAPERNTHEAAPEPSAQTSTTSVKEEEEGEPLTPQEVAELKTANPKLYETYRRMTKSHTTKAQEAAELKRELQQRQAFFDAVSNPATRQQALGALLGQFGMTLPPTDQPLRDQAKEIAQDPDVKELWSSAIGAEAAPILQPIVEQTALVAAKRLMAPLQAAMEELKKDADARRQEAQARQADAYVSEFRSEATKNGWDLTPEVETRMAQIAEGFVSRFSRPGEPIPGLQTREENIQFMRDLYRLATADTAEATAEKRILERMNKNVQSAEPGRGVPSTGPKGSSIPRNTPLSQAIDMAMEQTLSEKSW